MKFESGDLESLFARNRDLRLADDFAKKVLTRIDEEDSAEQEESIAV